MHLHRTDPQRFRTDATITADGNEHIQLNLRIRADGNEPIRLNPWIKADGNQRIRPQLRVNRFPTGRAWPSEKAAMPAIEPLPCPGGHRCRPGPLSVPLVAA